MTNDSSIPGEASAADATTPRAVAAGRAAKRTAEIWAIGDVQGCLDCLLALIEKLPPDARLWLVGDLVNRGPHSLRTLRWVRDQGERVVSILGNHDLHLLAVASGIRNLHAGDTLQEILAAPDRAELLDWLRRRPLVHHEQGWLMVHAGLLPQWTIGQAVALSGELQSALSGPDWRSFLGQMYGNTPARWSEDLHGHDRLRVIVNAMTRMRFCTADGTMDFASKGGLNDGPRGFMPWFEVPGRVSSGTPIVFGHWSAIGLVERADVTAIDSGCVWGGELTALRLSDRRIVQVQCARG